MHDGHVIVRRDGRFALLDLSQQPATFTSSDGFNRSFVAGMLADNGSADHSLHDMLVTYAES